MDEAQQLAQDTSDGVRDLLTQLHDCVETIDRNSQSLSENGKET